MNKHKYISMIITSLCIASFTYNQVFAAGLNNTGISDKDDGQKVLVSVNNKNGNRLEQGSQQVSVSPTPFFTNTNQTQPRIYLPVVVQSDVFDIALRGFRHRTPTPTRTPTRNPTPTATTTLPQNPTATGTALPATATSTALPPTATNTEFPPTATGTGLPPTATNTALPPTATNTALPPTATSTALPPTITAVPTATTLPLHNPSNPNATAKTKQVLNYLYSLADKSDKRIISGQHVGSTTGDIFSTKYAQYIGSLTPITNKTIGLAGVNYFYCAYEAGARAKLIDHWNQGGLVSVMSVISTNPFTADASQCFYPAKACLVSGPSDCGAESDKRIIGNFSDIYANPNSDVYKRFHAELDQKATWLDEYQKASVVILLRPMHEMNGDWFWWGNDRTQADYVALWRHVYDYFTNVKKLNNLLWVYSPNRVNSGSGYKSAMYYYPGNDVVDIVGLDYYYFEYKTDSIYTNLLKDIGSEGYNELVATGKPFALAEFGPGSGGSNPPANIFDDSLLPSKIKTYAPKTTYFMTWNSTYAIAQQNNATGLLNDNWVANIGDIVIPSIP